MKNQKPGSPILQSTGVRCAGIAAGMLLMACLTQAPLAHAQSQPVATTSTGTNCDPCVPPSVRKQAELENAGTADAPARSMAGSTSDRLRARFEAADLRKTGRITRTEAAAGGFGFIAQHFEAIDRQGRGEVSFEEVKAFLVARGARLE
jgi:hypothetical protein